MLLRRRRHERKTHAYSATCLVAMAAAPSRTPNALNSFVCCTERPHTEVLEWCVAIAKWAAQTQRVNITKIATTTAQSGSLMSSLHDFQSQIFFIFIFILIIHMVDTISSTMPGNLSAIEAV